MKRVAVLGATGSIGASTLDVIARHPDRFRVTALTSNRDVAALARLCARFRPEIAVVAEKGCESELRSLLAAQSPETRVLAGPEALVEAAQGAHADCVVAAIVGAAGLGSTLAAARAGKRLGPVLPGLADRLGDVTAVVVREGGATLLPIDSEHNAIFQCLPPGYARDPAAAGVRRILLTASGGPFRTRAVAELSGVTADEACAHPNWSMGRKISVDSATMMNKGLEVIEAHWLFGAPHGAIQVVIHPQSVIHSLVEYVDGSVLAQLGHPDMRTPIAQALSYPERIATPVPSLDLAQLAGLSFEAPDLARFPCLALAYDALRTGGTAAAVLNAANEVAVAAFLACRLPFTGIAATCAEVLARVPSRAVYSLDDVRDADAQARAAATRFVAAFPVQGTVAA